MQQRGSHWGLHPLPVFLLSLTVLVHEALVLMVAL